MVSVDEAVKMIIDSDDMYVIKGELDSLNTLKTCNTLWVNVGDVLTDKEGNEFQVYIVSINEYIVVTPIGDDLESDTLYMSKDSLTYLMGKPLEVNNEWVNEVQNKTDAPLTTDALPLVWLVTNYTEDYGDEGNSTLSASNVVLYFLENADDLSWTTPDHYNNPIRIARAIKDRFISVLDNYQDFKRTALSCKPIEKFGVIEVNGNKRLIIDAALSGYEANISMEILGCINC